MKRLIMVSMMFISGLVYADDEAVPAAPETTQSPHDSDSKNGEDSIMVANVHHINLDTTEVDGGGNWLNKRIWYERSQAVFGEIREMAKTGIDIRVQFSNEVNAVGQKIEVFWETVDYTKGELDDKFKEILTMLETEQKLTGDLSAAERDLQVAIKQELLVVEQIGKDIKAIHDVDNKIDDTLMQALKTIDECSDYETKAWDSFKAIGKELDDKKARNLYYQINNYKQNIEQKNNYLKSTLLPYLHNVLVAKVEMNISKINQAIATLKTKGVDLAKIMSKSEEDDIIKIHAREKAAAEIAVKKALEIEEIKAKEIAEKAAKALEEANNKSFDKVVQHYYQATIGKIVGFVHQGFVGTAIDSVGAHVKSYSFPLVTYAHHAILAVKEYMQNLVHHIMIYFGGKSASKAVGAEKIAEKMDTAENKKHIADKVKEKIAEKVAAHHEKTDKPHDEKKSEGTNSEVSEDAKSVADTTKSEDHTSTSSDSDKKSETASTESSSESSDSSAHIDSETDKDVVVQSLQNEEAAKPSHAGSFYRVFTTILDFIGTLIASLYNCVMQFFKLLMSFSAYIMSGN
jgi:hypothetical protein